MACVLCPVTEEEEDEIEDDQLLISPPFYL